MTVFPGLSYLERKILETQNKDKIRYQVHRLYQLNSYPTQYTFQKTIQTIHMCQVQKMMRMS